VRNVVVVVLLAVVVACAGTAAQLAGSGAAAPACPPELARTDATCATVADQLYEVSFTDGRKAWCRNAGSQAWCSVPVAPSAIGSGSAR